MRKHRQREASLGLEVRPAQPQQPRHREGAERDGAAEDEVAPDARCYFPLTSIHAVVPADDVHARFPLVRMAYRVIDKESYLDWVVYPLPHSGAPPPDSGVPPPSQ